MGVPFASLPNFLDPPYTEDGKPYGPARYKNIIQECWFISKHINTSYNEILKISPKERSVLIELIKDDIKFQNEQIEKQLKNKKTK